MQVSCKLCVLGIFPWFCPLPFHFLIIYYSYFNSCLIFHLEACNQKYVEAVALVPWQKKLLWTGERKEGAQALCTALLTSFVLVRCLLESPFGSMWVSSGQVWGDLRSAAPGSTRCSEHLPRAERACVLLPAAQPEAPPSLGVATCDPGESSLTGLFLYWWKSSLV